MAEIDETYGLIKIRADHAYFTKVANYTAGQADGFRKAMGKKAQAGRTVTRKLTENGFSSEVKALWDNYRTSPPLTRSITHRGLRAGALSGRIHGCVAHLRGDRKDKFAIYLADWVAFWVRVLSPDVNESAHMHQSVAKISLRTRAVRNVGKKMLWPPL